MKLIFYVVDVLFLIMHTIFFIQFLGLYLSSDKFIKAETYKTPELMPLHLKSYKQHRKYTIIFFLNIVFEVSILFYLFYS